MPNGVIGNTTDSGSVKSRFEPWLGNIIKTAVNQKLTAVFFLYLITLYCRKDNLFLGKP